MEAIPAAMIFPKVSGKLAIPDTNPRLRQPKLICVIALIVVILNPLNLLAEATKNQQINSQLSVPSVREAEGGEYPIKEFQQRAIDNSPEISVIDQAIKLMKSKKWTALAPGVGIGNNFVGDGDIRFNVNMDLVEILGGGKIRQINLDVSELELRKLELVNKLKLDVLERILALQRAERNTQRLQFKLKRTKAKIAFIEMEFEEGSRSHDSLFSYWQMEEDLEDKLLDRQDTVTLERARLEQLVGAF